MQLPADQCSRPIGEVRQIVCDYRSALRNATAPLHREVDALFGAFDLARHDGLARFLTAQAIGMQACQPRAMRFGRQSLGCTPPDYTQLLKADLAIFGIASASLPRLQLSGAVADAGVFYVVAGSRMGTAVLRGQATAPTPEGPANGVCGYFATGEGPAMWRSFRSWLAAEGREAAASAPPCGLSAMIEAATATFQLFCEAARIASVSPFTAEKGFAA